MARDLAAGSDILIENYRPGAMDRLGLGYDTLAKSNPRLIYCSERGFLTRPYQKRTALDEVAQMMGGLAYMTGPPGRPLRAGSSVIDVAGGMFGMIAILAAVEERLRTGRGQKVQSSPFETTIYLIGQHMAQMALPAGEPGASARLVLLNANDPFIGWIGLMQWTDPPRMQEYPGRNGGPVIRVRGCNFFDPDGTLIELYQILK